MLPSPAKRTEKGSFYEIVKHENMLTKVNQSQGLVWLSFPSWEKFDYVQAGFILKDKGESALSEWSKFKPELKRSLEKITGHEKKIIYAQQAHKNNVGVLNSPEKARHWNFDEKFDAFITNQPQIYLTVRVADCLPIFFLEPEAKVIGLIHAGWRGTLLKIVENTVEKAKEQYGCKPEKMHFLIGPGIGPCCFEISEELAILFPPECLTLANGHKPKLDLVRVNFQQLQKAGVKSENIKVVPECTYCNPQLYFSYRRIPNNKQKMVAFIGIES